MTLYSTPGRPEKLFDRLSRDRPVRVPSKLLIEQQQKSQIDRHLPPSVLKQIEDLIWIAGIATDLKDCAAHTIYSGASGSGKTTLLLAHIFSFLRIIRPGSYHKAVLFDPKPDFISRLKAEGIPFLLLNISDGRESTVAWDLIADCGGEDALLGEIAKMLFPDKKEGENFFRAVARAFFKAMLTSANRLHSGKFKISLIYRILGSSIDGLMESVRELQRSHPGNALTANLLLDATAAVPKTFHSVLSEIGSVLEDYQLFFAHDHYAKQHLSLRQWLEAPVGEVPGVLVVSLDKRTKRTTAPFIQLFFSRLVDFINARDGNQVGGKVFVCIEELSFWERLEKLPLLLSFSRSMGCHVVITIQQHEQLRSHYNDAEVTEILGNCDNKVWLRNNDPGTSQWISEVFGDHLERLKSFSHSMSAAGSNVTVGWQESWQKRIKPGALKDLPLPSPSTGVYAYVDVPQLPAPLTRPLFIPAQYIEAAKPKNDPFYPSLVPKPPHQQYAPPVSEEVVRRFFEGLPPTPVPISLDPYPPGSLEETMAIAFLDILQQVLNPDPILQQFTFKPFRTEA
jgi:Type IV secretion-system coupling protein DNA-binding domain